MSAASTLLGPVGDLDASQINERFQRLVAAQEWGPAPTFTEAQFSALVREAYTRPRLFTYVDLFCGAGGSSIGLTMAGGLLLLAANHSKRAIATHTKNFPDSEHECADINHYDMRKIPQGAQVLWASPICTEISPAGGKKRGRKLDITPGQEELFKFGPIAPDVFERTRATFHDVIRAAEVHRFPIVIVENVVDAAVDWPLIGWWLDGMTLLDYEYQIVCVSSAHVGGELNPHAPQRRDRLYIVFNRRDVTRPDVEPRPLSHCQTCGPVSGMQWWKKPAGVPTASGRRLRVGKYGIRTGQYLYRCPNSACAHSIVTPYERPAAAVIDWSDLGTRIGEREANGERPLSPNTLRRIRRGLELFGGHGAVAPASPDEGAETFCSECATYDPRGATPGPWHKEPCSMWEAPAGPPLLVNSAHDDDRAYPAGRSPFPARTTRVGDGLATPAGAFLDANGGNWNTEPAPVTEPFRTRTTRDWEALVTIPPGALVDTLRQNATPRPATEPFTTVAAGGNHHGLVVPYYTAGRATPTGEPFPTTTVRDRFGLAQGGELDVMEAHYRMVSPEEQARAQRFPVCYEITGNQGERTAQAGNAVSCNVAQWLGERVADALNRTAAQA